MNNWDIRIKKWAVVLLLLPIFSAAELPNLVLLPIETSGDVRQYETEFGSALQEGLQSRYTVFYGSVVERELEKEYSKLDCTVESCNQNVALAFNGELIADGSVASTSSGFILKLVISNVLTGEVVESSIEACRDCDEFDVLTALREIGAGKTFQPQKTARPAAIKVGVLIDTVPSGATIEFSDGKKSITPYQSLEYSLNQNLEFTITLPGYEPYTSLIVLSTVLTVIKDIELEKIQEKITANTFSKLDESGNILADSSSDWACTRDNRTGLVWEVVSRDGRRDTDQRYDHRGAKRLAIDTNSKSDPKKPLLCGLENWRLPDLIEFQDLRKLHDQFDEFSQFFPNLARVDDQSGPTNFNQIIGPLWTLTRLWQPYAVNFTSMYPIGSPRVTVMEKSTSDDPMWRVILVSSGDLVSAHDEMKEIPSGRFKMGSYESTDTMPVHMVDVSSFQLSRIEVTNHDWSLCVADKKCKWPYKDKLDYCAPAGDAPRLVANRCRLVGDVSRHPVINVTWKDTQDYLKWLNRKTGKSFRLPTEIEFEYATRAGTETRHYWINNNFNDNVNCVNCDDYYEYTAPVGTFPPNPFGLFDMNGNANEWTQDCITENYKTNNIKQSKDQLNTRCNHVLRGGGFSDRYYGLTSAVRITGADSNDNYRMGSGFRLVLAEQN